MDRGLHGLRRSAALWAVFALFALLVRAFVPSGYMLATSPSGAMHVSLCSGQGAMEVWVDARGLPLKGGSGQGGPGQDDTRHHDGDHPPCAFTALGLGAAPPAAPVVAVPALMLLATGLSATGPSIGRGLAAPPPHATGPPRSR